MSSNYFVLLVFCLNIVLAIVVSILNRKNNRNIVFLSIFLIIYALNSFSSYMLVFGGPPLLLSVMLIHFSPLSFLLPVMLYFYTRGLTTDSLRLRKTDLFHFIPFALSLIGIIPYLKTDFNFKYVTAQKLAGNFPEYSNYDFGLLYPNIFNHLAASFMFVIYLILCLILILQFYPKLKSTTGLLKNQYLYVYGFLMMILLFFLVFLTADFIIYFQHYSTVPADGLFNLSANFIVHLSYLFLIIPVFILFNSRMIYGFPKSQFGAASITSNEDNTATESLSSSENSGKMDDNTPFRLLSNEIIKFIRSDKPYLNSSFSITDICLKFNMPQHHVLYCMNIMLNCNFGDMISELRIKHAVELLKQNMSDNYSLNEIGQKSGFRTNTDFYYCFKQLTGYTPLKWIEKYRELTILN